MTLSHYRQDFARWGEAQAARYLEALGYEVLVRNFTAQHAEVDLICRFLDGLVFVEVKTRSNKVYGPGEQSVDKAKLRAIKRAVHAYLENHHPDAEIGWQIDIVVVEGNFGCLEPQFLHFQNVGASLDE